MIEASTLLAGPRGLRMLLAFALESERISASDYEQWKLHRAVADTSYELDPGRGTSRVRMRIGDGDGDPGGYPPTPTPDDVAELLDVVVLAEITQERLRTALSQSVDSARYWQEPDGEDVLAALPVMREPLLRVATYIMQSPHTHWWTIAPAMNDQWWVCWDIEHPMPPTGSAAEVLSDWANRMPEQEAKALRERPTDPTANWNGEWWSIPPLNLPRACRTIFDGHPAGLWFSEDTGGIMRATARRVYPPEKARVLEIDGANTWAELCRRFPLEVSAQKRHDWYRATGRVGRWVIPDWYAVSLRYHAVHLTVAGYLAASGTVIPVNADTASVIAGWNPDETWWFTDDIRIDNPIAWSRDYATGGPVWTREAV